MESSISGAPPLTNAAVSRAAWTAGVGGLVAVAAYALLVAVPLGAATPFVASLFGPLLAVASVALVLVLAAGRPTVVGLLAGVANVAAGALVTAMLLVQVSLDEVEDRAALAPPLEDAFEHVEFGLDLAWDVFIAAGTILFGVAMLEDPRFGRWFGASGIVVGAALYAVNFASFPTPPDVDLGPLVGLWYAAVSVRTLRLRRPAR